MTITIKQYTYFCNKMFSIFWDRRINDPETTKVPKCCMSSRSYIAIVPRDFTSRSNLAIVAWNKLVKIVQNGSKITVGRSMDPDLDVLCGWLWYLQCKTVQKKKVKRERGIKKRKSLEQRKMFEKNIRCLILLSRNIIITNFGLQSVISDS